MAFVAGGRVYARENASQRGNSSTAVAGTVASALWFVAKAVLTGDDVSKILETSDKGMEILRGQIASARIIGGVTAQPCPALTGHAKPCQALTATPGRNSPSLGLPCQYHPRSAFA